MTERQIKCRLIEERDVEGVAAIFRVAFHPSTGEVQKARKRVGDKKRGAVVALQGKQVVGFIFFNFFEEEDRKVLELYRVSVDKENRRNRVATNMITWLMEHANNFDYKYAVLEVSGGNVGAFKCYKGCGFVVHDSRTGPDAMFDDPLVIRMERRKG